MASRTDYLPTRIADLLDYADAYHATLAADPESFGQSVEAVADLKTTLDRAVDSHRISSRPSTRTAPAVEQTQADLRTLRNSLRSLTRQIQARPQTTDFQRETLGITVPDRTRSERPAPTEEPVVTITECQRHMVAIKIRREDGRAGKPAGISGMNVYYAVSPTVPTHLGGWTHAGQATRMGHVIAMPIDVPAGATIWVTANYYNGRGEVGPLADAATTNLPGGQARLAA